MKSSTRVALAALVASTLAAAAAQAADGKSSPAGRRVFFGELHLHTALSLDAWTYGTQLLPDDAYRFGRGETVMVPAVQLVREQGIQSARAVPARRAWPLDFMAVADHSESIGTLLALDDPNSAFAQSEAGKKILANPPSAMSLKFSGRATGTLPPAFNDPQRMDDAWRTTVKAANDNYRPGKFTTFIAYEWSPLPNGRNLHRNVIFNADRTPPPFTADQSNKPEDLWTYLESVRRQGIDAIAIPHNSNASGGLMFDWNMSDGKPIDEAYAQRRALNEPLAEIAQIKGQSETVPSLSPNDEFANFEIFDHLLGPTMADSPAPGSYIRDAYGRGLVIQSKVGANPFKYGLVGGSDIHNGLSASNEDASAGGQHGIDPRTMLPRGDMAKQALGIPTTSSATSSTPVSDKQRLAVLERSGAALTGVWAEENTRDSIFAAMKRKETFATSGTRIRLRMFAGWDFNDALIKQRDWVGKAYLQGVPMGSDLPMKPMQASSPGFIVQAAKDPDGANLDRIQIVKVWLEGANYQEKIFNVALSGGRKSGTEHAEAVGNTVDVKTGKYRNSIGAPTLTVVWRDPEFNAAKPAVYYARVLEIPTPRWSTLLAIKNQLPVPTERPASIQERAWSSPIWFTPSGFTAKAMP